MSITSMGMKLALVTGLLAGVAARAADEAPPPRVQAGSDGFSIASADGTWKLRFFGYAQVDGRFALADDAGSVTDSFLLRRIRPSFQIAVGQRFEATIVPEFGGSSPSIQDAYVQLTRSAALRFRAGKFKVPLAYERLMPGVQTLFIERSLASGLVPNRDVGVQVSGEAGPAQYALALVNGSPDGASADADSNDAKDLAARVFLKPFRKSAGAAKGLGFGLGVTTGTQRGVLPTLRTTAQASYFQYAAGTAAEGRRLRLAPQVSISAGPVGAFAEYVRSEQRVRRGAVAAKLATSAWTVTAAWLLTGEPARLGAVSPKRPFEPGQGGTGAWELKGRISGFGADDTMFETGLADPARAARRARALGVGLNWHLTRHVRQSLDFERTTFERGAASGDRASEHALLWRLQLSY